MNSDGSQISASQSNKKKQPKRKTVKKEPSEPSQPEEIMPQYQWLKCHSLEWPLLISSAWVWLTFTENIQICYYNKWMVHLFLLLYVGSTEKRVNFVIFVIEVSLWTVLKGIGWGEWNWKLINLNQLVIRLQNEFPSFESHGISDKQPITKKRILNFLENGRKKINNKHNKTMMPLDPNEQCNAFHQANVPKYSLVFNDWLHFCLERVFIHWACSDHAQSCKRSWWRVKMLVHVLNWIGAQKTKTQTKRNPTRVKYERNQHQNGGCIHCGFR